MSKPKQFPAQGLVRLVDIIGPGGFIPICRSSWYAGVKDGRFPKSVKLGKRAVAWPVEEIHDLIKKLAASR